MSKRWFAMNATDRRHLAGAMILAGVMAGFFVRFLVLSGYSEPMITPDSDGYVSVTEYLKGEIGAPNLLRISRPIIPILALPLSYLMDTRASFLVTNSLLFILLVGVFYVLAKKMMGESRSAFHAVLLLICAYPVYYRGINVTVDLASWLIFLTSASAVLHFTRAGTFTLRNASALAAASAVGTLVTELVVASFLLVLLQYLLEKFEEKTTRSLITDLLVIGLAFSVPVVLIQIAIALTYDFDIFEQAREKMVWIRLSPASTGPPGLARSLLGAFTVSLLFLPFGVIEFRNNVRHARLHLAMLIAALVTLLAIHVSSLRFTFVLFPLVFTINIRGIRYLVVKFQSVSGASDRSARFAQTALVAGVCSFNLLLYVAFYRYGSTIEMARQFVPFLID